MVGSRSIDPVDTIWLNMDRPNNLMVIESLILLESSPDWARVVRLLRSRLLDRYPVFHQLPRSRRTLLGRPHWADDPDFSLERHIHRATLRAPGDDAALQRYIEGFLHVPFDRDRPLWEMHFIDGVGSGAALYCRFHHALADGVALTQVLLSLTDETADADTDADTDDADGSSRRAEPARAEPARAGLVEIAGDSVDLARAVVDATWGTLWRSGSVLVGTATPAGLVGAATLGVRTSQVVRDLLLTHNPDTALGGAPGLRKRAVWSHPLPLADLKRAGRMAGATLNDVLLSAVAGALGRYLVDHGGEPTDLTTMVPVNVRPRGEPLPAELGNRFALVFFTFPSGVTAPLERLAETKRRMDWLKGSPEAPLTFGLITAIGRTVSGLERQVVSFFANKAIGVTTNVVGPTTVRYLAGTRISGLLGWVPGSGRHTVGICVITYMGTVRVGFRVDADRVKDPEQLLVAFEQEVADLVLMARAG